MSGFTASNSRIKVIETVGTAPNEVDQTVFDTDDDMPHILSTAYIQNVTVDFDDLTETAHYTGHVCAPTTFLEQVWGWSYEHNSFYWYWDYVYNPCGMYVPEYEYRIDPEEYSNITNLANLPADEDGNAIDIDFVIVQATGARTLAGKDPRFNQALPTTVPAKTFSFQGSVLLESSGKANGDSWFRRIMSIYPGNGKLKLKVQESVRTLARGAPNSAHPHINDTRSTYSFNFKVFFGKFRQ